ncbi:zinc finger protein Xfin-like [Eurosta solidaginis]|uniref:zinc finger protein Xfin-like n=1 Tax=Eurosta solidaginis TaxID=178769 RepID=UPI003530A8FC
MVLEKMCRVCLLPDDRVHLLDWHQPIDSFEYALSYKECFCQCTQINLSLKDDPSETEDDRTQYLCFCCAQSLKDAHEFIEKAKKADIELRSRQTDKTFEWVAVSAKSVEIEMKEDPGVDDKNCLEEINETNIWNNETTDKKGLYLSNNIDEEDISIANLKKELEEHSSVEKRIPASKIKQKRKDKALDENTTSEDEEDSLDNTEMHSSKESDKDTSPEKKIEVAPRKKDESKVKIKKPRKNKVNLDEMVACEVCKKVMKRKALRKHKHKPRTFLCKACPRTFSEATTLKNHERTHDENRRRFPCEKCDQSFLSPYSYKAHLKTHDLNRKPSFQCPQCDKAFLQRAGLLTHMLHHEGPKWKCTFCDKRYVRQSDLTVHLRTHSGETPFQCNICGKSYIHKRILNKHMQQHGGFVRYTCLTCGEQFSKYDKYYTHRQQHFGLPYKCGVCERQFNDAYKCKRHVRGVHKIIEDIEVEKLSVRQYDTKEHRGRIVEVLKSPEEQDNNTTDVTNENENKEIKNSFIAGVCRCAGGCKPKVEWHQHATLHGDRDDSFLCDGDDEDYEVERMRQHQRARSDRHRGSDHSSPKRKQRGSRNKKRPRYSEQSEDDVASHDSVSARKKRREEDVSVANIKSYACQICGKRLSTQHYLRIHMNIHRNERELHQCNYCDKIYISKIALENRIRLHKGETIKCDQCGLYRYRRKCMNSIPYKNTDYHLIVSNSLIGANKNIKNMVLEMCRVCLLPDDRVHLLDWHQPIDSFEYVLSYKECFCQCTQINLSLNDDPSETEDDRTQYLCFCCAQSLKDAHEFIEKAKKADIELRSRQTDKTFEWVAVSAKSVEIEMKEDPGVDDKNCLEEINETNIWNNETTDKKGLYLSNNIDEEDISIANLKKELEEHSSVEKRIPASKNKQKRKDHALDENTKSEDEEDSMNNTEMHSSKESDKDTSPEKKIEVAPRKKDQSKVKIKKPRKNKVNLDEMVACEVCKKVMKRKALRKHKHKPRSFLCKACPRTFSEATTLKNHERTHDENRRRFPCEKCDQSFLSSYSYKAHLKTHDLNRKPSFQCTQCDKAFLQRAGLLSHMLHHEGPKWKCTFCDKRYVRQSDLTVHLRTHSGETPFQCNICGKSYIHIRILNKHMQQHGGFVRYTCLTCGEQFSKYNKYYAHRQQHFGLPYKCVVCERQFNDAYKCKRHVRGVHKIIEDSEVEKLSVRQYDTKEHRGRIVEVLKSPEEQDNYTTDVTNENERMDRMMCRVCLLPENEVDLLSWHQLIDTLDYALTYKECFCKCTQINVSLKDDPSDDKHGRTQYLCFYCAKSLKDAHEFIEKARKADKELRSRQIERNFEWVAVGGENVEIIGEDVSVLDVTSIWHNQSIGEEVINLSDNIDQDDITVANIYEESHELCSVKKPKGATKHNIKGNAEVLNDNTKFDHDSCSDRNSKKVQKHNRGSKTAPRKSEKDTLAKDEKATCEVCQKIMSRKALLKHKHRHKPKTFLCQACPKVFLDSNSLERHEVIHDENREKYPCDKCNQSFLSRSSYKYHVLHVHDINRKPMYQCTQCDKSFSHKNTFRTHLLRHEGPKIKCNFCDKRYVRQLDLKVHLETHSGETPFLCNVCGRSYVNKRVLKKHMQQHEGFFRYTCKTCGAEFSKYHQYYLHRQQHTGCAYKCGICERQFYNCYSYFTFFRCKRHIRRVHKVIDDSEIEGFAVKMNDTREHRGRIVEVLKNADGLYDI